MFSLVRFEFFFIVGTPEDYNKRVRRIIDAGATAISLLPCCSGFRGIDCDEVDPVLLGTCGTVINTTDHMDRALDGVPIGEISTAMNDPSPFTLLAFTLGISTKTNKITNIQKIPNFFFF